MTKVQWTAVAAVIRMGFLQDKLFPVRLALPFVQQTLFGSCDDPLDAFMHYIPEIHRYSRGGGRVYDQPQRSKGLGGYEFS